MKKIKPWHLIVTGSVLVVLFPFIVYLKFHLHNGALFGLVYLLLLLIYITICVIRITRFLKRIQLKSGD